MKETRFMIVTLLIWSLVFLVSFSYGFFIIELINNDEEKYPQLGNPSSIIPVFFIGFIFCYILASILTFFMPLRGLAFLIILIPALFLLIKNATIKQLLSSIKSGIEFIHPLLLVAITTILLIYSLWLTSGAIQNSDSYIYHAQSIHWIEKYPVISGLGNFFNRLAYNSGWFVQNALFSFSFLNEQSFHVLNGLIIFAVSIFFILEFVQAIKKNEIGLIQVWGLIIIPLGIITIGAQASAPSTDMPVAYLAWMAAYLCMRFKPHEKPLIPIFLVTGLIAFAFTIKISIAPLVLLPAIFFFTNLKAFNPRRVLFLVLWVVAILVPWMARNVIISGYAVYPSATTALPVAWQIPKDLVEQDALGIRAFGFYERAPAEEVMSKPVVDRLKFWYFNLTPNQKGMFLVSLFSPIIFGALAIYPLIKKRNKPILMLPLTIVTFYGAFLFWLFVSPNLRFGYVYLLFLFTLCLAAVITLILGLLKTSNRTIGYFGIIGFIFIISIFFARSFDLNEFKMRYLLPLDYDHRSTQPCLINNGQTAILCAAEYGECGYYPFPCHAWGNEYVRMRSTQFRDGFYLDGRGDTP